MIAPRPRRPRTTLGAILDDPPDVELAGVSTPVQRSERCVGQLRLRRQVTPWSARTLRQVDPARRRWVSSTPTEQSDRGRRLTRDSPALARQLGLATAYQDGSAVAASEEQPHLAAEPGPLGPGPLLGSGGGRRRASYRHRKRWKRDVLRQFDLDIELFPDAPAERDDGRAPAFRSQGVTDPKVLLDEPTTARPRRRGAAPHGARLCRQGVGVVYVSHRLPGFRGSPTASPCCATARREHLTPRHAEAELVGASSAARCGAFCARPLAADAEDVLVVDGLQGQRSARSASRSPAAGRQRRRGGGQRQSQLPAIPQARPRVGGVTCASRTL